jgi:hypothetical protein
MMRGLAAFRNYFVNSPKNDNQVYRCLSRDLAWLSPKHSIIDIATWYELDGLGFEAQWRRDFSHSSRSALGPTQPAVERVTSLLRGGKSVAGMVTTNPTPI